MPSQTQIEQIRTSIIQAAAKRGLRLEITLTKDFVTAKTIIDDIEVRVDARICIPRRKRSHPEVTVLPNPYANRIVSKIKESIIEALNAYSILLPGR